MTILLAVLLLAGRAAAETCSPPWFYKTVPRDRDWFYGVARDADTDKARDLAIRNLGKQVTGDVEGWEQADLDALAPCQDRWKVAAQVGKLLPQSSLLAGWEQDDFERCDGQSYVLVRVEKDRVARYIKDNAGFRKDVAATLSARLERVESDVAALTQRLERLEQALGALPPPPEGGKEPAAPLREKVARLRAEARSGKADKSPKAAAALAREVAAAEDQYTALLERVKGYGAEHDKAEQARLDALIREKKPELDELRARFAAGKADWVAGAKIVSLYNETKRYRELRDFARAARDKIAAPKGQEGFFGYMVLVGDSQLKDDDALIADGEEFLKRYPESDLHEAARSLVEGTVMKRRYAGATPVVAAAAAAAAPAAPSAQPCPADRARP